VLGCVDSGVGGVSVVGGTSGIVGGWTSGSGIGSGAITGAGLGAFFFGLVFFLPVRFAFFLGPFFAFLLIAKQSHRPNVEPVPVIKLP
jgi:hypothetical protein